MADKREVMITGTKMGRPTDDPKPHRLTIRLNDRDRQIITAYAEQEAVTDNETIRRGIRKLEADIKAKK